jgi:TP901-1 family phage major tail protein
MSVLNGSDILIYDADTTFPLMCQRGVTVTMSDAMIDATCKQSGGYMANLAGLREFSITAEALVDWVEGAGDTGINTLIAAYEARTPINIAIANSVTLGAYYVGLAYVESIEINAPMEDVVTYSASFTGTYTITD